MAKQNIQALVLGDNHFGALELRVLDILAPMTGTAAPTTQAEFIGQEFVDTTAKKVYKAVAIDSVSPADDWVELAQV